MIAVICHYDLFSIDIHSCYNIYYHFHDMSAYICCAVSHPVRISATFYGPKLLGLVGPMVRANPLNHGFCGCLDKEVIDFSHRDHYSTYSINDPQLISEFYPQLWARGMDFLIFPRKFPTVPGCLESLRGSAQGAATTGGRCDHSKGAGDGGGIWKDHVCTRNVHAMYTQCTRNVPTHTHLSLSLSLSVCLSIYLSIHPSIYLSIHPSIYLSIYTRTHTHTLTRTHRCIHIYI